MNDTCRAVAYPPRSRCFQVLEALESRALLSSVEVGPPVISVFLCDVPSAVSAAEVKGGRSLTLSAQAFENRSSRFRFYADTNDNGVLDKGDKFLGTGKRDNEFYSLMVAPPDRQPGDTKCRFFVQASGVGGSSVPLPLEVEMPAVNIGAFVGAKAVVQNKPIKLSVATISNAARVDFFQDTNHNGRIDETDNALGAGTRAGKAWKFVVTTPMPAGLARLMARAADAEGNLSATWILNLTVVA